MFIWSRCCGFDTETTGWESACVFLTQVTWTLYQIIIMIPSGLKKTPRECKWQGDEQCFGMVHGFSFIPHHLLLLCMVEVAKPHGFILESKRFSWTRRQVWRAGWMKCFFKPVTYVFVLQLSFSPTTPMSSHIRVLTLLIAMLMSCCGLAVVCAVIGYTHGMHTLAFMAAEVRLPSGVFVSAVLFIPSLGCMTLLGGFSFSFPQGRISEDA